MNLTREDLNNKLLLGTDNEGRIVWDLAARRGHLEAMKKIWE